MAVFINGETLYVAWLGDSQVVLCKAGQACQLMNPHKPDREVLRSIAVFFWGGGGELLIACVRSLGGCSVGEKKTAILTIL